VNFFLDDRSFHLEVGDDATLEQAIRAAQNTLDAARRIVVGFRCDGEEMVGPAMIAALRKPAKSFDRVEAYSAAKVDLVVETMTHAADSLDEVETETGEVAQWLVQGRSAEAIPRLGSCLTVWQQVHDAVTKSLTLLDLDPAVTEIREQTFDAAMARPRDVLLQIKNALLAQDYVLLADVLQYEFSEVTQLWHAMITRVREEADGRRENVAS